MVRKLAIAFVCAVAVLAAAFGFYVGDYYRADRSVDEYLASDSSVMVEQADYGWYLDGPSEEDALIFYPGAKVDEKAYIPLLHRFAEGGMDVCLVKMPFHLAFLGMNRAADVMRQYTYTNWYIGGHSLGGAMAANFAADHGDGIRGLVLLAAYPTKKLPSDMIEILLYGSEDHVLRTEAVEEGRQYAPEEYCEYVIKGGNHAQFGSYGVQKGDGKAVISASEQLEEAVRLTMEAIRK